MGFKNKISPALSMIGFDLLTMLNKRKKVLIPVIVGLLTYWITDHEFASIIAGIIFEGVVAVGEFYFKEVKLEE